MAYTPRLGKDARATAAASSPKAQPVQVTPKTLKEGTAAATPAQDGSARPLGKTVVRRRRRRDTLLAPQGGWALIGDATGRLGLWEGLAGYLAQQAFALAVAQLVPRLGPHARAERLAGDTLVVRVSSSAVASELSYVRDLLLAHVNDKLRRLLPPTERPAMRGRRAAGKGKESGVGPIRRLQHRVGVVAELPDALEWTQRERRPPPPRSESLDAHGRPRRARVDPQVATALSQVQDEPLRRALGAMYAASLNEPESG